jgi:uncharacterized RDD family membrane protein YckC
MFPHRIASRVAGAGAPAPVAPHGKTITDSLSSKGQAMPVDLLIWLLVVVAIAGVVFWFIGKVPVPEPFRWIVYLVFAIIAIYLLLQLPGLLQGVLLRR